MEENALENPSSFGSMYGILFINVYLIVVLTSLII